MVREPLILKTDNGTDVVALLWEDNAPILWEDGMEIALERQDGIPFKGIEITEYSFKSPRMGMPTLTAELYWPTCLDSEWTGKEFVELRGERYYLRQIQSSEISNNNVIKYKHSLEFKSEREILSHVYFYDAVPSEMLPEDTAGHDKPCTNSTTFKFFGTICEFADRLNCAFRYAGIGDSILQTKTHLTDTDTPTGDGYCVVVSDTGDGDLTQSQNFEFEDKWLWDALSEGFDKFKIPFVFHGKKIVFNEKIEPIERVFSYGFDNELLSVKKNNANARIINRITFKGSGENIPYFYPNTTEYGNIALRQIEDNTKIPVESFRLVNPSKLVKRLREGESAQLNVKRVTEIDFSPLNYEIGHKWVPIEEKNWIQLEYDYDSNSRVRYMTTFTVPQLCDIEITGIYGKLWIADNATPSTTLTDKDNLIKHHTMSIESVTDSHDMLSTKTWWVEDGRAVIKQVPAGTHTLIFNIAWGEIEGDVFWMIGGIKTAVSSAGIYYWSVGNKNVNNLEDVGVIFTGTPNDNMVGGGFCWTAVSRMPFQTNLMPPKYRQTIGDERFYDALNDTYTKQDGSYYFFKNPYIEGNPNEYIFTDENIKPTIEGVKNAEERLFGEIADIAFDSDDNDSLKSASPDDKEKNDAANYEHSFFYIKINKFDGPHGFNLFDLASQTAPMTIQMTSGPCDGCKFKIQVAVVHDGGIEVWRNPVQVKEADGDIVDGPYTSKVREGNPQPFQQNSMENSLWLCVQKDAETFGVIMPNRTHNYMPHVGDTFNIINIDLPQGYIDAAEERGRIAMLDFMENNNEEKFNFDITASRIFFAQNPELLRQLNEYSRIKIEYNGKIYEQYVSELAIDCKDNEVLPDVKITLADTLSPTSNFVQEVVAQAADISKAVINTPGEGGGVALGVTDKRYLRKDASDRTKYSLSSDSGFEVGNFVSGSQGGVFSMDPETGKTTLEVDYVIARMKAFYEALDISNVRSIGGKQIVTPGGGVNISFVEELTNSYRCYFKHKESEMSADCRFVVGDDAYCQSFNISDGTEQSASNKFYWRAVTAVSNDGSYIELSKTDCATNSAVPAAGDSICQLGSDNTSRRSAIILSTEDEQSPNITLYDGITGFVLGGHEVVDMGVDKTTGKAYLHVYGNTYIGDKDGNSYAKYDNFLKELEIKARLTIDSTVGEDNIEEYIKKVSPPVKQEDIEGFVNNIVNPKFEDIQNQLDGVVETHFASGVPTLENYPASEWNTDALKKEHLGDLYYDNDTGTAYRFSKDEQGAYYWNVVSDDAVTKALKAAKDAQDTADKKRRVFTAQPIPPYDNGDLWANATYPADTTADTRDPANGKYYNDILRCDKSKASGTFAISDWVLSSNYTDDTLAKEAKELANAAQRAAENAQSDATAANERLNEWAADGVISPTEKQSIKDEITRIDADKEYITAEYKRYGLAANVVYVTQHFVYRTLLSNLCASEPENIAIPDNFATTQSGYYEKRTSALSAIATAAKKYAEDTAKKEATQAVAGLEYLKKAMANGFTQFNGGLMLSSHIRLGEWDNSDPENPLMNKVYAGMNGIYINGRSIASWWGGDMVDLFDDKDKRISPAPENAAKALVRMDGSAYFSEGNIGFKKDGSGWLGNDLTGIKFTSDGTLTIGGGIKIDGSGGTGYEQTLQDITNFNIGLTRLLKPYDADNQPLTWTEAAESDGAGGIKAKSLRASVTFASSGDVVAFQNGDLTGGSGGGGLDIAALEKYLTNNGYATQTWVSAHFNNYVLTKDAVEKVLTGDIATHTHSQYLTAHQSLAAYLTRSDAESIYQKKDTSIYFYDAGNYLAARFDNADFAKRAGEKYIEFWNSEGGWWNFQLGTVVAQGEIAASKFVKRGGSSAQFLKADGSVDNNSYALVSALDNYYTKADVKHTWTTYAGKDYVGWVRIMKWDLTTANQFSPRPFILSLYRGYNSPSPESYTLSFTFGWNTANIVQLNGMGERTIEQFRITKTTDGMAFFLEYYVNPTYSAYQNTCRCMVSSYSEISTSSNAVSFINEVASGDTIVICSMTTNPGHIVGNATSAEKLFSARRLWGQNFDGTGNVTGSLSDVADINMSGAVAIGNIRYGSVNGLYAEVRSGGNELVVSGHGEHSDMYVNNRQSGYSGGSVPKTWKWLAGNSTAWANHEMGGLTAHGALKLPYNNGSWAAMATSEEVIKGAINNTTQNAHALLRIMNSNGAAWVMGGYDKNIGIYGFTAQKIASGENYPSWQTVWNADTGELTHTGDMSVQSLKIGGGTITWDAANNVFIFSHTVASKGDVVAFKQ